MEKMEKFVGGRVSDPIKLSEAEEFLSFISPNCGHDEWFRVLAGMYDEFGDEAHDLCEAWSAKGDEFNSSVFKSKWKSLGPGNVKIGTVIKMAQQNGWKRGKVEPLSTEEKEKHRKQAEVRKAKAAAEERRKTERQEKAKVTAQSQWNAAQEADNGNPYLTRKGVKAHGLKSAGDALLMPLHDLAIGEICNLQTIYPEPRSIRGSKEPRDKDFIPGARKSGLCHLIGDTAGDGPIAIAEGYATAATVHELTGWPVYVAVDAGNLKHIAKAVRAKFKNRKMVIAADNDQWTQGNPGLTKANDAAKAIKAAVVAPQFPPETLEKVAEGEKGPTDWNDLYLICGDEITRAQLNAALRAKQDRKLPPGFFLTANGLFHDDAENPQGPFWICSPLEVLAVTRDDKGKNWGILLSWVDLDGKTHTWSMPMQMLAGDGNEFRRILLDGGLRISASQKARNLLTLYIQTCEPAERARSVTRTGWHDGVFVLPGEVIGESNGERVLLQTISEVSGYEMSGNILEWQSDIAAFCAGNSRLILAICTAFSPALLDLVNAESGGVHLYGNSSTGKSTMLYVAASVCGGPNHVRRWRATDNGLEALAENHNDGLLCLDELKELDPKYAGPMIYMLINGQGKQRSGRGGEYRVPATWRLMLISTGELSIADHVRDGGGRVYAGQEVRIVDIQADAGAGLGLFDCLHDKESGVHLSQHLMLASKRSYGHPSREFIRRVVADREGVAVEVQEMRQRFAAEFVPDDADGQVYRVADRFALVAAAGELATKWGITGWNPGEALTGVKACFADWMNDRGGAGKREDAEIIRQVRRYLEEHGDARFEPLKYKGEFRTMSRAGYVDDSDGKPIFYVLAERFKDEVCKGYDAQHAARTLQDRGYLHAPERGRLTTKTPHKTKEGIRPRVYAIKGEILEDD